MALSVEVSRREIINTPISDEQSILILADQLTEALAAEDAEAKSRTVEQQKQRYLFSRMGQKRHESRPHHLQASPVKAEAILTGQPTIAPWRR